MTIKNQIEQLKKLSELGDKAAQAEWYTTREIVDIDYYDVVRVKGAHNDLPLFCYEGAGFYPNYTDQDAQFITQAANARQAIKDVVAYVDSKQISRQVFLDNFPKSADEDRQLDQVLGSVHTSISEIRELMK